MNSHQHARMTVHGRALLVNWIMVEHWRVVDAAVAAGISERTAYRWLARFRSGGERVLDCSKHPDQNEQLDDFSSYGVSVDDRVKVFVSTAACSPCGEYQARKMASISEIERAYSVVEVAERVLVRTSQRACFNSLKR